MNFILSSIYFALPAILANSFPVFVRSYFKSLAKPVDGGKLWRGKPILGAHKTWRGFIVGTVVGIAVVWLQRWLYQYDSFRDISYINYEAESVFLVGFLLGFGALFGDAVKSLIKRRLNVQAGAKFFPWDQLDSVIGAGILILFIKPLTWQMWLFYIGFALIIHPLTNFVSYKLGFKDVPW
jgi:CDP-2,3-bis-(O-geranylgeranyl)-sn-glycerol synthase